MDNEVLDEEFSIMYEESARTKVLDAATFRRPIKHLKVRRAVAVECDQTVMEAVTIMQVKRFGCVLVTRGYELAGILTERDVLVKALGQERSLADIRVEEIMTPNPQAFQPEDSIAFVMNAMHVGGFRHVPVVDDQNRPVSVISIKDVVAFIVENFPEDLLNLPPRPLRRTDQQDGG